MWGGVGCTGWAPSTATDVVVVVHLRREKMQTYLGVSDNGGTLLGGPLKGNSIPFGV